MIPSEIMEAGFANDDEELDRLLDQMSDEELDRLNNSLDALLTQVEICDAVALNKPFQL